MTFQNIESVHLQMVDEIKGHFGQFGAIESVVLRSKTSVYDYCFVQFERHEDAAEALLRTGNNWIGYAVKAADPLNQPDHPLKVPPEQDSDLNIHVALNDHCLLESFKGLNVPNLANVAGVCVRFNKLAKVTFASEHKHLDLCHTSFYNHDLIETAMKHFGKDTHSLCIDANLFSMEADAFRIIEQNCGPTLKQIELRNFQFQIDLRALRPIFAGIDRLELYHCFAGIGVSELMAACVELKSLKMSHYHGDDRCIMNRTFPKLQEFSIHDTDVDEANLAIFENFVIRHPTLIKLSIEVAMMISSVFRAIGQHAKNLQELEVTWHFYHLNDNNEQTQSDAAFMGQLSSLKKLKLHLDSVALLAVLNALVAGSVPIENLEILFTESIKDDAMECILQLKQIKILHLETIEESCVTDADVIEMAKCLPELEKLHLIDSHIINERHSQLTAIGLRNMLKHANKLELLKIRSMDSIKIEVDDYKAMLSTVQERKEKVPLVIEIYGKGDQVDVPAAVLAQNQSTFNIKEIRFEF